MLNKSIKITQIRSSIGIIKKHKLTLLGLGLKNIGNSTIHKNTPSINGMIKLVSYMLKIEEIYVPK